MGGSQKQVVYLQSALGESQRRTFDAVRGYASAVGWNLCAIHYGAAEKCGDPAASVDDEADLADILAGRRPDGCIVEDSVVWGRMAPAMRKARVPYVLFDAISPERARDRWLRARIVPDNAAIVDAAAKTLFAFNYADYAFVPHHEPLPWAGERECAFGERVAKLHARFHVYRGRGENVNVVSQSLVEWLRSLPRPCGVLACNDQTALRVLEAALAAGIRVPDEMPVVGIDDDLSKCETGKVSLSSVRLDVEDGARRAAAALCETMQTGRRVADATFAVQFVSERASTRPLRIPDGRVAVAIETIRHGIGSGITATEVARAVGVPLRSLHRRFLNATGHTLGLEIREARFSLAKRLLSTTDSSVAAIANFCGYDSDSSLRKAFAQHGEPSPLKFRMAQFSR